MTESANKITRKIVGYRVEQPDAAPSLRDANKPLRHPNRRLAQAAQAPLCARAPGQRNGKVVRMHEGLEPDRRKAPPTGQDPVSDHAMYVTIKKSERGTLDNAGARLRSSSSKNLDHYQ